MKKSKKALLLAGVAMVSLMSYVSSPAPAAEAKVQFNVFDFEPHRGGRDARPENTLYSYQYALEQGATSIEADMQLTKDGNIVMSHNPILNPSLTRDSNGNYITDNKNLDLRQMTLDEIKKYDVGVMNPNAGEYYDLHGKTQVTHNAQVPTLDELFKLVKDNGNGDVFLNLEIKSYPDPAAEGYKNNADIKKFVKVFNQKVKKYGMENRVILQSFDWAVLKEMHEVNPNITLSALWCQQPTWGRDSESLRAWEQEKSPWLGGIDIKDFKGDPIAAAHSIGADIISPYYMELSKDDVDEAHALGMKVVPWTVNSPNDINMMLDMGVDGLISDKPWILRTILTERGVKLNIPVYNAKSKYHLEGDNTHLTAGQQVGGNDAAY